MSMHLIRPLVPTACLISLVVHSHDLAAQSSARPSCTANLDSLVHRIELDYAGAKLELVGERRTSFDRSVAQLRERAARTASDDCFPVLSDLTNLFDDPHLFIFQSSRVDSGEAVRRAASVRMMDMNEARARVYLDRNAAHLDPIEGIWSDGHLRAAIVRDSSARGRFIAVVLAPDTSSWRAGAVRARISRRADGSYDVEMWDRNYAIRHLNGGVYKRVLLRLSPGIWGKEYPVRDADRGLVDAVDPHRATILVRDKLVVVSVPSHDPTYKGALDTLLARHRDDLQHADRLIVDVRGNEGGSSWITDDLLRYVASEHKRVTPFDSGEAVMLSSPDQITYAKRAFGSDTSAFVRSLVKRLTDHPGELVPLYAPGTPKEPEPPDSVIVGPRRVGVLIDRGTVSASEVLVLRALRSERARVYGEPTAGALDYQSVNIVRLSPAERQWYLGYGTITARASLPSGGMRGKGIPPDVVVDWSKVADPIAYVDSLLKR
jgi:hypothetical protein